MENAPLDPFPAFDFFMTAYQMAEWKHPGGKGTGEAERREKFLNDGQLLRVCQHIATGAKHYRVDNSRMNSVARTKVHHGAFTREFSREFDISHLRVDLRGEAAEQLGE